MSISGFVANIETFRALLVMSIAGAVIATVLFAVKPLIKNRLPKTAQYYLWIVVLAAFLVPASVLIAIPSVGQMPSISSAADWYVVTAKEVGERIEPYERSDGDGYIGIPEEYGETVEALVPEPWVTEAVDWAKFLCCIGAFVSLSVFVWSYYAYVECVVKKHNRAASSEQAEMLAELTGKPPRLYINAKVATPMLIGLFNPAIILPDREYTAEQLRSVLLHELTHLRRKDILIKWLSVLAVSLHWFNPLAWLMRRELDRACELACDEAVIRKLDEDGRQSYGDTLISVAAGSASKNGDTPNPVPRAVLSTTMCEDKKDLKERLGAIMSHKKATKTAVVCSVALVILLAGCAATLGAGSETSDLVEMPAINWDTDWLGNLDGERMTIEQLKQVANNYVKMNRYLTITDLADYKSINFSSDSTAYLMEYPTLEGFSLSVRADATRIISRMSIRRVADNVWLGINADTLDKIEDFITGAFTPEVVHPLWDVATPHRVQWSEDGYKFAWQHADNPMLAAVSSLQYLPTVHFDDKASLEAYAEAGDKFYDFKELLDEYDEHFFDNNRLVLVYIEEGMGSIQHQPLETTAENGVMMIPIERFGPGTNGTAGTTDMLARFIFIECDKEATKEISDYRSYLLPDSPAAEAPREGIPTQDGQFAFSKQEVEDAAKVAAAKLSAFGDFELLSMRYDEDFSAKFVDGYLTNGRGATTEATQTNTIVLLSDFKTDKKGGDGSFNPSSTYTDWMFILIRDNENSPWVVSDWGY